MREAHDSTSVADFMVPGPQAWGPVLVAKLFRAGQALDGGPALPLQDRIHSTLLAFVTVHFYPLGK